MNTEEMFQTILNRMDSIEAGMTGLYDRMDELETTLYDRMNVLQDLMIREFLALRARIYGPKKSLQKNYEELSGKFDKRMYTKDAEWYDKINTRLEALEKVYQELKEKIV